MHHAVQEVLCAARERPGEEADPHPPPPVPERGGSPGEPADKGGLGHLQEKTH